MWSGESQTKKCHKVGTPILTLEVKNVQKSIKIINRKTGNNFLSRFYIVNVRLCLEVNTDVELLHNRKLGNDCIATTSSTCRRQDIHPR